MKGSILIVEDDERLRSSLARVVEATGAAVHLSASAEEALPRVGEVRPDLILSDVRMPGMSGLELLRLVRERAPAVDVVLMTAYDDLSTVAAAMKEGAADFLVKPLDLHQLRLVLHRVLEDRRARARAASPATDETLREDQASAGAGQPPLIGHDPKMVEIFKVIGRLGTSRASVIIRGESGTGKELIARAIHSSSAAAAEPFVAVNCTSLPASLLESELFGHVKGAFTGATRDRRGRFALAGRGTLFLDEIGDTTLDFQSKLLRVLQEQEYYAVGAETPEHTDARVIAATHRDLERMMEEGAFREDLYYRLRVVEITVPPLRERRGDIPPLIEHMVARAAAATGKQPPVVSSESAERLLAHEWPGNVRELENCLTRAVVLATGGVIRPAHLALNGGRAPSEAALRSLAEVEAEHVERVLAATGDNRTRAAEVLGISRPRLRRLMEKHGLNAGRQA